MNRHCLLLLLTCFPILLTEPIKDVLIIIFFFFWILIFLMQLTILQRVLLLIKWVKYVDVLILTIALISTVVLIWVDFIIKLLWRLWENLIRAIRTLDRWLIFEVDHRLSLRILLTKNIWIFIIQIVRIFLLMSTSYWVSRLYWLDFEHNMEWITKADMLTWLILVSESESSLWKWLNTKRKS